MSAPSHPVVVVLAAIVEREGRFLVSRRLKGTHLENLWEFPGGKCEPAETHEACLARELTEELGVTSTIGAEILVTEHAYPEPQPMLGQQIRWVARNELMALEFPEADRELIARLTRDDATKA